MGIDKPDVRFVVHADARRVPRRLLPGDRPRRPRRRAGRAVLLYRPEDLGLRRFFAAGAPDEEALQQVAGLVRPTRRAGMDGVDVTELREETGSAATRWHRALNLLEQAGAVVLTERRAGCTARPTPAAGEAAASAPRARRARRAAVDARGSR